MKYDNKRELLEFLKELDCRLQKLWPNQRVPIYIFGGAAVVLGYSAPRATMDLDVFIEHRDIEKKLLEWGGRDSELQRKYGLYVQSANMTFMPIEDPQWRQRSVKIMKGAFKCFVAMVLNKEDLILSKLGRYSDKDRADIQYLLENFKINPRKLISYYKGARSYYAGNLKTLDKIFNIVLKENFNLGPLSLKK